jgi:hypothetical protein
MRVRIREKPAATELDGVQLDGFVPGTVREVSAIVGTWLIANRYADLEMRRQPKSEDERFCAIKEEIHVAHDHPHRRSTDR